MFLLVVWLEIFQAPMQPVPQIPQALHDDGQLSTMHCTFKCSYLVTKFLARPSSCTSCHIYKIVCVWHNILLFKGFQRSSAFCCWCSHKSSWPDLCFCQCLAWWQPSTRLALPLWVHHRPLLVWAECQRVWAQSTSSVLDPRTLMCHLIQALPLVLEPVLSSRSDPSAFCVTSQVRAWRVLWPWRSSPSLVSWWPSRPGFCLWCPIWLGGHLHQRPERPEWGLRQDHGLVGWWGGRPRFSKSTALALEKQGGRLAEPAAAPLAVQFNSIPGYVYKGAELKEDGQDGFARWAFLVCERRISVYLFSFFIVIHRSEVATSAHLLMPKLRH